MKGQYISDGKRNTRGLYIPINEWNSLKEKYRDIETETGSNIPDWHKKIVQERLKEYQTGKVQALDLEIALDDIEKNI